MQGGWGTHKRLVPHDVRAEHRSADVHRRADDPRRAPERGDGRVQVALDVEPVLEQHVRRLRARRGARSAGVRKSSGIALVVVTT